MIQGIDNVANSYTRINCLSRIHPEIASAETTGLGANKEVTDQATNQTKKVDQITIGEEVKRIFQERAWKVNPTEPIPSSAHYWGNKIKKYAEPPEEEAYRVNIIIGKRYPKKITEHPAVKSFYEEEHTLDLTA